MANDASLPLQSTLPIRKLAEVEPRGPGGWRRPKTIVRKSGLLAPLLGPIGIALGLLIVGIPAILIWNIYGSSEARRLLHDAPVPKSATVLETGVARKVADGEIEFILRQVDGRLVRVITAEGTAKAFLDEALASIEDARRRTHEQAAASLDALFAETFASRQADLDAYADWFFAWGRSWRLLYEAATGAVQEALRLGFNQTQVTDAARHAVEAYLLRHYQEFVLKAPVRDPFVVEGTRRVVGDANAQYLAAVAALDERFQVFVRGNAVFSETIDKASISVRIDWDTEKWRAPRQAADSRSLAPIRTVALAAGGAVILGPIIDRAVIPALARATAGVMSSTRMAVSGAALGSVEPGLGTAIGALGGLALDWGINAFQGRLERGDFIEANAAALDATIATWKTAILPEIDRSIDVWFDDAWALIARQRQGR